MKIFKKSISILFLVLGTIVLASCSDDKDEPVVQVEPKPEPQTTYTITTQSNIKDEARKVNYTGKLNYVIIEFNDSNEVLNIQEWEDIRDGTSFKKFIADSKATKLVIEVHVLAYDVEGNRVTNFSAYYDSVYYLNENENLNIIINGQSKITHIHPIEELRD